MYPDAIVLVTDVRDTYFVFSVFSLAFSQTYRNDVNIAHTFKTANGVSDSTSIRTKERKSEREIRYCVTLTQFHCPKCRANKENLLFANTFTETQMRSLLVKCRR